MRALFAARWRRLRLLPRAGGGLTGVLILLQLSRAVVPTARALSAGWLIAALSSGGLDRQAVVAAALVAGLFLADQLVWSVLTPVAVLAGKRIDGDLRARLRTLAGGLPGLDRLESQDFQDLAARAADSGMGISRERSPGTAATGQLELLFRLVSAGIATALLATFSPLLALGLLAVSLLMRAIVRRQWIRIIDTLDADTAGQRHEYYLSEQAVLGAAKDVRLFGLSDWFGSRFRAAAMRTYAPV